MTEHLQDAEWNVGEWHGKMLVDRDGERIGKLQDVYVDVENDEPQFATVKEGFIGRHLTFVPLGGIQVGPDELQVGVTKEQVKSAPNIEQHGEELSQADESSLYHHYELNYTPPGHRKRPPARSPLRHRGRADRARLPETRSHAHRSPRGSANAGSVRPRAIPALQGEDLRATAHQPGASARAATDLRAGGRTPQLCRGRGSSRSKGRRQPLGDAP